MDKQLLKRALQQTFASPDDEETNEVLDTLAENLLTNLHKEKAHVNVIVAEAYRSGGLGALEQLRIAVVTHQKNAFSEQDVKDLINEQVKKLN